MVKIEFLSLKGSEMIQVDALIIGAGPIGGYLAKKLCQAGHTVLMIEEHNQIGRPFQCAGLVNPGSMEKVGLESTALTRIWGARIHGPGGTLVEIGSPAVSYTHLRAHETREERGLRGGG